MTPSKGLATCSVAIPVHNGGETIDRAIDSVLGQSGVDWSCLISLNECNDSTATIVEAARRADPRISAIHVEPMVPAPENFRLAFERARTLGCDFFTWLAADDEFLEHYLAHATARLKLRPEAELVVFSSELLNQDSMERLVRAPTRHLASKRPFVRLLAFVCQRRWNEIYSVYQPSSFDVLSQIEDRFGFDVLLTWRLLLRGPAERIEAVGTRYAVRGILPTSRADRIRFKLSRVQSGPDLAWGSVWRDLFRAAREAPTTSTRLQARLALLVACLHPNWIRKFAEHFLQLGFRSRLCRALTSRRSPRTEPAS